MRLRIGAVALAGLAVSSAALAAGSDIRAAERAVAAQLPKGARFYFSAAFETEAAVCGVVSSNALPGDADRRFAVALAADASGRRKPGRVLIDGEGPADFEVVWNSLCTPS